MNNQEILKTLAYKLFKKGCGTPMVREIQAIGREKYYNKKRGEFLDLFNQLDKSTLPIDKITELEQIIREQAELQINQGNIEKSVENNTKFYLIIEELLTLTK